MQEMEMADPLEQQEMDSSVLLGDKKHEPVLKIFGVKLLTLLRQQIKDLSQLVMTVSVSTLLTTEKEERKEVINDLVSSIGKYLES